MGKRESTSVLQKKEKAVLRCRCKKDSKYIFSRRRFEDLRYLHPTTLPQPSGSVVTSTSSTRSAVFDAGRYRHVAFLASSRVASSASSRVASSASSCVASLASSRVAFSASSRVASSASSRGRPSCS